MGLKEISDSADPFGPRSPAARTQERGSIHPRLWFWIIAVTTVVFTLSTAAAIIALDRARTVDAAERRLLGVARLLENHTASILRMVEVQIDQMAALVGAREIEGLRGSEADQEALRAIRDRSPEASSLWLYDAQGRALVNTVGSSAVVDASDREYIRAALARPGTVVGTLIRGRVLGTMTVVVARRLTRPDGSVKGIAGVSLRPEDFADFFSRVEINGPNAVFSVLRRDGSLVLRSPLPQIEVPPGAFPDQTAAMTGKEGVMTVTYRVDGVERAFGYRWLDDYPVVVTAGMATEVVLAPWRQRAWVVAAVTLGWLVLFTVLARLTHRALALQETERQTAQAAARRAVEAQAIAVRASTARSRFFASANHDLRQPLQALRLFMDVMLRRPGAGDDATLQHADRALAGMESLVSQHLDMARVESGILEPSLEPVALPGLLADLAAEFAPVAADKGLRLRLRPRDLAVVTDRAMLHRVLRNLLSNAVRYTQAGGVLVGVRLRGGQVAVEVWDSGRGIADEHLDLIWEEFYQVDNPERDRHNGLGLGLAIVHKLADKLGHRLAVRSRPGRGTMFRVVLGPPAAQRGGAERPAASAGLTCT